MTTATNRLAILASFICLSASAPCQTVDHSYSGNVDANGTIISFSDRETTFPAISPGDKLVESGTARSEVAGFAQYGEIGGSLAVRTNSPGSPFGAEATFLATFEDGLRVVSSSLAQNTPVDLIATIRYSMLSTCNGSGNDFATSVFNIGSSHVNFSIGCNQVAAGLVTATVHTFIGAVMQIEGQLSLTGTSQALGGEALADPPVFFYIDTPQPNVSLESFSGAIYATPVTSVPEPGVFALFPVGVGLVAARTRWRQGST